MTHLGDTGQVQATRQPAQAYRQRLRRLAAVDLDEWEALRALEYAARGAEALTTSLDPEAWIVTEEEHGGLTVIVRVVRWEGLAIVVGVRVSDGAPLLGAAWTGAAVEQLEESAGLDPLRRRWNRWGHLGEDLHRLIGAYAGPVDVGGSPESWRARLGPEQLDVSLMAQRVDREGTPLVVSAEARPLRARGRSGRGRGS